MARPSYSVRRLKPDDIAACERLLAGLPDWFGFEETNRGYIHDLRTLPAYVAIAAGEVVGFLAIKSHTPAASEVHVLVVARDRHREGIGRALLDVAEGDLTRAGIRLLHVKTLGPSKLDAGYEKTRAFYSAMGFLPLEELELWGPDQPCLIMVKVL